MPPGAAMSGAPPQQQPMAKVASGGCDNKVRVWQVGPNPGTMTVLAELPEAGQPGGHTDWVRDVAWAPSIGLSNNILATGSQDHTVIIWHEVNTPGAAPTYEKKAHVTLPAVVWRCSWSVTGSILAVSCGDNKVYLLKESADGVTWEIVSTVDQGA